MRNKILLLSIFTMTMTSFAWADRVIEINNLQCFKNGETIAPVAELKNGHSALYPYVISFLDQSGNIIDSLDFGTMGGMESSTKRGIVINSDGIKVKKKIKVFKISSYFKPNDQVLSDLSGKIDLVIEEMDDLKTAKIMKQDLIIFECK